MRAPAALLATLLLVTLPAAAQYVDEEELEDQRAQDERYYERYLDDDEEDATPTEDKEPARRFLEQADTLIRDKNYRSEITDRFVLQTDDPRLDLRAVARLLDAFGEFFERFWADRATLRPLEEPSRVFLFYSYYKYNQLVAGDWRRSLVRPKGHYGSLFDAVVIHTDSDRPGGLANTLVHEAAHRLLDRRLFGAETAAPPLWVSEGLATYFGETFMSAEGKFETGVVGPKKSGLLLRASGAPRGDGRTRLKPVRRALKAAAADGGSVVGEVVGESEPGQFYGGGVLEHYAVSWLLVHYLLHGDDGAHAGDFARYLELEARGHGGAGAFFDQIGMDAAGLDAALLRHVGGMEFR